MTRSRSRDVQVHTRERLLFGPDCDRTPGGLTSPYDEPLYAHMTELNARTAAADARAVMSGLGGDEIVAVGSAESRQAALDKHAHCRPLLRSAAAWSRTRAGSPANGAGHCGRIRGRPARRSPKRPGVRRRLRAGGDPGGGEVTASSRCRMSTGRRTGRG
jgi:hypothetical protein